jgi:glycosyltransferase involved in cell wall biosynthesis
MIVKNEAAIIARCLRAVANFIDCYVICDTGSTDNTVEIIETVLSESGVRGEIQRLSFENFEQARNAALKIAQESPLKFDYILFCDADMELIELASGWKNRLSEPAYMVLQRSITAGLEYPNIRLIRRDIPARYVGVTHEYLDIGSLNRPVIPDIRYLDHAAGSSRNEKYDRDIRLLSEDLKKNPDNARSVFYLANSYFEQRELDLAERWYNRRLELSGYQAERFISMYRIGSIYELKNLKEMFFLQMLLAHDEFPDRAEPLHKLALSALNDRRYHIALTFASLGIKIKKPEAGLFVEADVYEWRLFDIAAVALFWKGFKDEALALNERILPIVPHSQRDRILKNIAWCKGE